MRCEEVFTPFSYPKHTYVQQADKNLESKLRRALENPAAVVSLVGPSKSGKTVLLQNVVDDENKVVIQGSEVTSNEDLWRELLKKLDEPTSIEEYEESDVEVGTSTEIGGGIAFPTIARIWSRVSGTLVRREGMGETKHYQKQPFNRVVSHLKREDKILFIDDFHYLSRETQEKLTEAIKEAARQKVNVCIALIPHRSNDIVRGNPDLHGRVYEIDTGYWNKKDLMGIGLKGFEKLGMDVMTGPISRLADEAAGSPQLMQLLCQELCSGYSNTFDKTHTSYGDDEETVIEACENASNMINHSHTVDLINSVPEQDTANRTVYEIADGRDDIYGCILRAISTDPPRRQFSLKELIKRLNRVCYGVTPSESEISDACRKMEQHLEERVPKENVLDWDEAKRELTIPDPYFLFHLRWYDVW